MYRWRMARSGKFHYKGPGEVRELETEKGDRAGVTLTSVLSCGTMCFISSEKDVLPLLSKVI